MAMDRVIDEIILVALCLLLLPFAAFSGAHVAALLCAIVVACCFDVYPHARLRFAAAGAYELAALFVPEFSALLPVVAYVLFGERFWLVRLSWIMPLAAALRTQDVLLVPAAVLCAAACLMAWRTKRAGEERERYRALRDEQQEASLSLANKNRELMAAQDYEVRLATLSERSRIAREIHDNVGHLLTRSVLQVEALQVVHADDECVRGGLASVGATLHEAMDTVRKSVHDLHDEAFDPQTTLAELIGEFPGIVGTLAFEAANAERKTFTADLPKELQGKLKKTEPVGRQGYMGELGMNAELAKAAFAAKVNEWFPVAYTLDGGAVIARVAEVVTPSDEDWKTAAPQITDAVLNAKREQMFRGFLSLLRSNAKIELKNETILAD
mgnify:CR=1 FL=1